jgi:hypothetical protein
MTINEFKKQVKELAVTYGYKKSEVSIKADSWIRIYLYGNKPISDLTQRIKCLAGYKNNSDIITDYFEYSTTVKNSYNGTYNGLIIVKE